MNSPELIKQVQRRQAIWNNSSDNKKMADAWHQICKMAWADFHTKSREEKRTKCLELQKKWKRLKQSFVRDHLRQEEGKERGVQKSPYYDQLSFLAPTVGKHCSSDGQDGEAARASTSTLVHPSPSPSPSLQERDAEEDRQFLLSLVSFMQDVPRSDKLALRSEILQAIAKYSDRPRHADPAALSQEY